ncbi:G-protein coupled estrogen receptor 1-like [Anolis sagrei]|uniref:G-protein coupled estrogen receptor 1-like n=1 Tax=Anolis sagrei TaxID=38937 RepID=UPI0035207854
MVSHNMSWLKYPSRSEGQNSKDIIHSNDVIAMLMHVYIVLFVPIGLIAGIIILGILIKNCMHRALKKLDIVIFAHTISNIVLILLSFTVTTRPGYLKVSYFECGILSFFFNLSYFSSQYLRVLMVVSYFFSRHPPQNAFISKAHQNIRVCIGSVLTYALCTALIVTAMLGTVNNHEKTDCQLDPLFAWPEYEIIKFSLGFCIPSLAKLFFFILLLVKKTRTEIDPSRQSFTPYLTVFVISITMVICRLFYNVMLIYRALLKLYRRKLTIQTELTTNIAEIMLFSESCLSLLIILFLHKPCRSGLLHIVNKLTKVCRRRDGNNTFEIREFHTEVSSVPSENESHLNLD